MPNEFQKVIRLEEQVKRIVSDIESEKRTRAQVNTELTEQLRLLEVRVRELEKTIWKAMGGLAVLNAVVIIITALLKR